VHARLLFSLKISLVLKSMRIFGNFSSKTNVKEDTSLNCRVLFFIVDFYLFHL
jgi:hypothetical protein